MTSTYTSRPWNDDDRDIHDHIPYCHSNTEEFIPVHKILKQMYDEDKERLYYIDAYKEYTDAMERMWDDYYEDAEDWNDNVQNIPFSPRFSDSDYETDYAPSDDETITVNSKFCYI